MTREEIIARAKRVIEIEQQAITGLLENIDQEFVDAIGVLADVVEAKSKIVVVGVGSFIVPLSQIFSPTVTR